MRVAAVAVVLGAIALHSVESAQARDGEALRPTTQWAIEYADASCRLIRNFGDPEKPLTLAFERFQPGPDIRLGIAGGPLRLRRGAERMAFRYGPDGPERETSFLTTELADGRTSYLIDAASLEESENPPKAPDYDGPPTSDYSAAKELIFAREINSLSLTGSSRHTVSIELGPMEKPIQALQACVDELMHEWGVDPEHPFGVSRAATPTNNPGQWLTTDDYPSEMLRQFRTGIVRFRLVVNEQGQVDHCYVAVDKPGPFEDVVCKAIGKRARFEPALDEAGKPMKALFSNSVRFSIP
jgi:hypothetical protein